MQAAEELESLHAPKDQILKDAVGQVERERNERVVKI